MSLMPVEEAQKRLLASIPTPGTQDVVLAEAHGRILAEDLAAHRDQPPFAASAMDGYAVRSANIKDLPTKLQVVGEVPAGTLFPDSLHNWEAVRIFTGAPVPEGANAILIQENTERDGAFVMALEAVTEGQYIRPAGMDFKRGDVLIKAGTRLTAGNLALAAAMNRPSVKVRMRPKVAILATGDELILPGENPRPEQIVASNTFGVAALASEAGADILDLGLVGDDKTAIAAKVEQARAAGADILVTSGGASVGDHDLVQDALTEAGMALDFWRIAMRPGKPLMAGKLDAMQVIGLPGNPVSAMVCAILFLCPLIRAMQGDTDPLLVETAALGSPVAANDKRQSYLRASLSCNAQGGLIATPFTGQDSAMLAGFARADCLLIRPPHAAAVDAGASCQIIRL